MTHKNGLAPVECITLYRVVYNQHANNGCKSTFCSNGIFHIQWWSMDSSQKADNDESMTSTWFVYVYMGSDLPMTIIAAKLTNMIDTDIPALWFNLLTSRRNSSHFCKIKCECWHQVDRLECPLELRPVQPGFCEGNQQVTGGFPSQGSVTGSFFSFMLAQTSYWTNNRVVGDLRHPSPYEATEICVYSDFHTCIEIPVHMYDVLYVEMQNVCSQLCNLAVGHKSRRNVA